MLDENILQPGCPSCCAVNGTEAVRSYYVLLLLLVALLSVLFNWPIFPQLLQVMAHSPIELLGIVEVEQDMLQSFPDTQPTVKKSLKRTLHVLLSNINAGGHFHHYTEANIPL